MQVRTWTHEATMARAQILISLLPLRHVCLSVFLVVLLNETVRQSDRNSALINEPSLPAVRNTSRGDPGSGQKKSPPSRRKFAPVQAAFLKHGVGPLGGLKSGVFAVLADQD